MLSRGDSLWQGLASGLVLLLRSGRGQVQTYTAEMEGQSGGSWNPQAGDVPGVN